MKVIVVGCGRIGSSLAYQLYKKGHQVTVIDQDAEAFDNLPADFHGRTIKGDVLVRNVLYLAEIEEADALAAATSTDSLNALVAYVAQTEYRVAKVVAWNYDLRQRPLQEAFGIPVIGSTGSGAQQIEELLSGVSLRAVFSNGSAHPSLYQLEIPASWDGRTLQELLPEVQAQVIAWMRAGQPIPTAGAQALIAGDLVYLNAGPAEIEALRRRMPLQQERSA